MAGRPHQSGLLAWSTKAMRAGCRSATAARSAHSPIGAEAGTGIAAGISGSAAPRNDASSRLIIARAATAVTPPAP